MASSVALGFAMAASPEMEGPDRSGRIDAAWLWPVDHPDVTAHTLHALDRALGEHAAARPASASAAGTRR